MSARDEWANTLAIDLAAPANPRSSRRREMLTTAFYDRRRILGALLLGLLLTAVAAALAPRQYTAEASLLLRLGREYIYTPEVGDATAGGAPVAYDREQTMLAETKILTSRDLKEAVLQKMGVPAVFPRIAEVEADPKKRHDAAMLAFEKALEADLLKGSNLMQISFSSGNPAIATKVLTQLIDSYLARRSTILSTANVDAVQGEFNDRKNELRVAEQALAEAKSARRIRAFGEEQTLLLAQRNALEMRASDMAVALAQASARTAALGGSLKQLSGNVTLSSETQRSDALENARKLLLDLKLKERDLSTRFAAMSPLVADVRADIGRTNDYIRELESNPVRSVKTGRNPTRELVESDLLKTTADRQQARYGETAVAAERAAVEARLAEFAISERQLPALERALRMAEANYELAAKRLRDERAMAELDRQRRSNVSLVQSPSVPVVGKSFRPVIVAVGIFLSFGFAVLTAFLCALWRDTFISPEEVERTLGLPLLATVPVARRA